MEVTAAFDGGSIGKVYSKAGNVLSLTFRKDTAADIKQWFYFRLVSEKNKEITLRFEDAAECTYPEGWEGYNVVLSHDNSHWRRVPTSYEGGVLSTRFTPLSDITYCAYFQPYPLSRHLRLLGCIARRPEVSVQVIGTSVEGRDLDLITVGSDSTSKRVWVVARQHPGETMGQWLVEGLVRRLLRTSDEVVATLLSRARIYCIPNLNPDGATQGNLRTNAKGANLNRAWAAPSASHTPEVLAARSKMMEIGVDIFLDIHGTERLPYVFIETAEHLPTYSERQRRMQSAFVKRLGEVNRDFQTSFGYPSDHATKTDLRVASKQLATLFDSLSLTVEMPFKDNALAPEPGVGWSGERAQALGADMVHAVNDALAVVR